MKFLFAHATPIEGPITILQSQQYLAIKTPDAILIMHKTCQSNDLHSRVIRMS